MATKIKPGRYKSAVFTGYDENGKRLYKTFYGKTADEADYLALSYKTGNYIENTSITVGKALEDYIASREGIVSPTTARSYNCVLKYRFQSIMPIAIDKLTSRNVQLAIRDEMKKGMAPKTIKNGYMLILSAIHSVDPKKEFSVTLPSPEKPQYNTPDAFTLSKILKAAQGTNIEVPILLAACCSLRMSEITGLRWSDVKENSLEVSQTYVRTADGSHVKKQTKTVGSTRTIPLPSFIRNRILALPKEGDRIFEGTPNETISHRYTRLLKSNGIPHSRFHDLRHAFASHAAALGIPSRTIQGIGGWESDNVMRRVYQQSFRADEERAMETLSDYFCTLME